MLIDFTLLYSVRNMNLRLSIGRHYSNNISRECKGYIDLCERHVRSFAEFYERNAGVDHGFPVAKSFTVRTTESNGCTEAFCDVVFDGPSYLQFTISQGPDKCNFFEWWIRHSIIQQHGASDQSRLYELKRLVS